jgi:phosphoribosyl-ATP pyrophosphohydrolase
MVALAHYGLSPTDVLAELERRVGTSGLEEKALRKVKAREAESKAEPKAGSQAGPKADPQ